MDESKLAARHPAAEGGRESLRQPGAAHPDSTARSMVARLLGTARMVARYSDTCKCFNRERAYVPLSATVGSSRAARRAGT